MRIDGGVVLIVVVGIALLVLSMVLTGWFVDGCWKSIECLMAY